MGFIFELYGNLRTTNDNIILQYNNALKLRYYIFIIDE